MKKLLINNEILSSNKRYTPNQLKAFYTIIYQFKIKNVFSTQNSNYNGETEITLSVEDFEKIYSEKKISRKQIMSLIKDMGMYMFIYEEESVKSIPIFSEIRHIYNSELITFKFNPQLIDIIVDSEYNFSEIILENIFKLNKKYSGNLYELYCRFKNQKIYKMPLDKLLYFFDVPKKYSSSEMERAVLNSSIKEIKQKLNINISYSKEKKNGKITHYIFKFK